MKTLEKALNPMDGDEDQAQESPHLSSSAVARLRALMVQQPEQPCYFRVSLSAGGCSGFTYEFSFTSALAHEDITITQEGISMLFDPASYALLEGATIDYAEKLADARFLITSPQATATCGCGASFAL